MRFVHREPLLRLLAAFAMLLFVGDLLADSVADLAGGHCDLQASQSTSDHETAPCSHCSCATHIGAVIIADFAMRLGTDIQSRERLRGVDQARPSRLAGSIDHPPQLA